MDQRLRQDVVLVMVAVARWGKGDGFLIFSEREDDVMRLGCKGGIYRHLETLMKSDF